MLVMLVFFIAFSWIHLSSTLLRSPMFTLFPYTTLFRSEPGRGPRAFRRRPPTRPDAARRVQDRKSTRLNSSHVRISYAVFCLKKKNYVTPASSTPVLHTPTATSSTLYFDRLTVNDGDGG